MEKKGLWVEEACGLCLRAAISIREEKKKVVVHSVRKYVAFQKWLPSLSVNGDRSRGRTRKRAEFSVPFVLPRSA